MAMLDVLDSPSIRYSPGDLSYGQRKLVELAQVLWAAPLLVMLDEPAAGISPALSKRLSELIQSFNRSGVACCSSNTISHSLANLVRARLCDGERTDHHRGSSLRSAPTKQSSTPTSAIRRRYPVRDPTQ